jgi:hypothetical protein
MQLKIRFTLLMLVGMLLSATRSLATTYEFVGNNDNWNSPIAWSPQGIPGEADTVIFNAAANSVVILPEDITVGTMIIEVLSQISGFLPDNGLATLTIKDQLVSKFVTSFSCNLVIASTATAEFVNTNYPSTTGFAGIYLYGEVTVNGTLTDEVDFFSATKLTINGTWTHKRGGLGTLVLISPTGTLNINSPSKQVGMSDVVNQGTFNWQGGDIAMYGVMDNSGTWNISTNDSLSYEGFDQPNPINNTGLVRVLSNVTRTTIQKRFNNQGIITIDGPSTLHLMALQHTGAITGPATSTLELSGYYFGTGNKFEANSVTNVGTLKTNYLTSLDLLAGCNISNIQNFDINDGPMILEVTLPPAANYILGSQISLGVDQTFTGNATIRGGFYGSRKVTFDTPNATWNLAWFGVETIVTLGSTVTATGGAYENLKNDGTINWTGVGDLNISQPGIVNNGTMSFNAPSTRINQSGFTEYVTTWLNNGTINIDRANGAGAVEAFISGFSNQGNINVGENDTLRLSGQFIQNSTLAGAPGSYMLLYGGGTQVFKAGATTSGFSALETFYGLDVILEAGTNLSNINKVRFTQSAVDIKMVLPTTFNYEFVEFSEIRLSTSFRPTTPLLIRNSTIEGSGNLKIPNQLNWQGGIIDLPTEIEEDASASISETNEQRPIISSPFTNKGNVTLSGGIIEINTGFFKNKGTWQVISTEDVIIDGFTPFVNNGTFAICGNQPIQIDFNVPFTNADNGTFKGEGTYTFNADYTNEGTVAPGCSPGLLQIDGDFQTGVRTEVEIESADPGNYDFFQINGELNVSGELWVYVPTGAAPAAGPIKIIEATGGIEGTFSTTSMPVGYTLTYTDNAIFVNSTGAVTTSDPTAAGRTWKVLPTLATDQIRIELGQTSADDQFIQVFNAQGQVVRTGIVPRQTDVHTLNLVDLVPGMYSISSDTGAHARFIKM